MKIYVGIFEHGKLIMQIGNAVTLPKNPEQQKAVISTVDWLVDKIAAQYSPIDGEYVAYDYR